MKKLIFKESGDLYSIELVAGGKYKLVCNGAEIEISRHALNNFAGYERACHDVKYYQDIWGVYEVEKVPEESK